MHDTANESAELRTSHANVVLHQVRISKNTALLGNSFSSGDVVTSDHPNTDTGLVALLDGTRHLLTDDILDTSDGDKSEALLALGYVLDGSKMRKALRPLVVVIATLASGQVTVGEGNGTQSLGGILLDLVCELLLDLVVQLLLVARGIKIGRAGVKDDLRGTLGVQTLGAVSYTHLTLPTILRV